MHKKSIVIITILSMALTTYLILNKDFSNVQNVEILGKELGFVTFIPTILTVILAFISKNVILALSIGFLSGGLIVSLSTKANFFLTVTDSLKNVVFDFDNIKTLLVCFVIGAFVEIVMDSGGFEAIAIKLENKINNAKKANLSGVLLGCLLFFDDYANAMMLGPIMTRFGKRLKIAKEKVAYIVNFTSAPISGICLLSSWAAVELSCVSKGIINTTITQSPFELLKSALPYCFYCVLSISFIIIGIVLKRDFGPMYQAEKASQNKIYKKKIETTYNPKSLFVGVLGLFFLIIMLVLLFIGFGYYNALKGGLLIKGTSLLEIMTIIISCTDSVSIIILATFLTIILLSILCLHDKLFNFKSLFMAILTGFRKIVLTAIILVLAWSLSDMMSKIGTVYYAVELIGVSVNWMIVPIILFITCCIISTASGSFGTMFVIMPLALPLANSVIIKGANIEASLYFSLVIAAVIMGSIFGDACSPTSDCVTLTSTSVDVEPTKIISSTIIYTFINVLLSVFGMILILNKINIVLTYLICIVIQIGIYMFIGKRIDKD